MATQIKKPARRIFDAPIRLRAGVPQITRRFLFADTRVSNITRADIRDTIANASPSSELLFRCEENTVKAAAVRAGAFNAIAMPRVIPSAFERFFCEKTPAFL